MGYRSSTPSALKGILEYTVLYTAMDMLWMIEEQNDYIKQGE
jgi:hypothetical protein